MFNSREWSKLVEETYGYKAQIYSSEVLDLHYSCVKNEIGEYVVAPAFGDFIFLRSDQLNSLEDFISTMPDSAIGIKVFLNHNDNMERKNFSIDGFVHQVEYKSYVDWRENGIKCKFRNQINQGEKNNLDVQVSRRKDDFIRFWEMHARLRIEKFGEISQPKQFFLNFYERYLRGHKSFIFQVFDKDGVLIAGSIVVIEGDVAYYKYSASYSDKLNLRPNNLLIDRLVQFLDGQGIYKLNLGYTGLSADYAGLRKFKLSMGADEYPRYKLVTPSFFSLDRSIVKAVNDRISNLVLEGIDLDQLNDLSNKHYKYFV